MPYCSHCGTQVGAADKFCAGCGSKQSGGSVPPRPPQGNDFLSGISDRNMRILCYIPVVGWIACVIVLASERFRHDSRSRFHAFQGIYLFVAWLFIDWIVNPILGFPGDHGLRRVVTLGMQLTVLAGWIIMLTKSSQDQDHRLPIIGDLAERSANEQRS